MNADGTVHQASPDTHGYYLKKKKKKKRTAFTASYSRGNARHIRLFQGAAMVATANTF